MPIEKEVEVCSYKRIFIDNEDIIEGLEEKKDAIEVIEGLLVKYPDLADIILKHSKETVKLYPKGLKDNLIKKYMEENKSILAF